MSALPDEKPFRRQEAHIAATEVLRFVKSFDVVDKADSKNKFTALAIRGGALLASGDFTLSAIDTATDAFASPKRVRVTLFNHTPS